MAVVMAFSILWYMVEIGVLEYHIIFPHRGKGMVLWMKYSTLQGVSLNHNQPEQDVFLYA